MRAALFEFQDSQTSIEQDKEDALRGDRPILSLENPREPGALDEGRRRGGNGDLSTRRRSAIQTPRGEGCVRRNGSLLGALILESTSLAQARMNATARGLDQRAEFAGGQEIDSNLAALLPPTAIGLTFTPYELLDYLEKKRRRIAAVDRKPAEQNDARNNKNQGTTAGVDD